MSPQEVMPTTNAPTTHRAEPSAAPKRLRAQRARPSGPPHSPTGAVAIVLGWGLLVVSCYPQLFSKDGAGLFKFDAWVYYHAIDSWRQGGSLYDWWAFPVDHLYPFTYPPFAAWLLMPLTWGPDRAAQVALTLATPLCTALVVALLVRGLGAPWSWAGVAAPWGSLLATVFLEPFQKTMEYGQVNAILLALVVVDLLALRPGGVLGRLAPVQGVLSGLAAAVKLTPAIAVVVLLARRQWRAAAVMSGAAGVATLLATLASPQESWRFFTQAMLDPTRAGDAEYAGNQNLRGAIVRILPEAAAQPAWVLSVLVVLVLGWFLARRLGEIPGLPEGLVVLSQTGVVMTVGLLVSPISWSHHWVWCLTLLTALGALAWRLRSRSLALVVVTGVAVFALAMHWWLPEHEHVELYWPWWAKITGASYPLWALTAGAVLWVHTSAGAHAGKEHAVAPVTGAIAQAPGGGL